jgi:hypothetical protein
MLMKERTFPIDQILSEIIQSSRLVSFTITELRKEYMSCMPGCSSHSPNEVRRYLYKQVGRLVRIGWLSKDGERMSRNIKYRIIELPAGTILKQTEPWIAQETQSEPSICSLNTDLNPSKAIEASSLHDIEAKLNKVSVDLIATVGEAETYRAILDEHPWLQEKLKDTYLITKNKSLNLMGQLRALEQTVKILGEQQ